jgi:thiol-disulfide isomerase/thioredoxin
MKKILIALLTVLAFASNLYAEDMEMVDTDGKSYKVVGTNNEIKIEGMEGKVVFLEFFGLKCPGCKKIMPNLIDVQEKYKDKVQVMAIEVQKNDINPINAYKQEHGINYITLSNYDVGRVVRYIMEKSGWQGAIPFVVAIDSKGQVQFAQAGVMSEEDLGKYVEKFSK